MNEAWLKRFVANFYIISKIYLDIFKFTSTCCPIFISTQICDFSLRTLLEESRIPPKMQSLMNIWQLQHLVTSSVQTGNGGSGCIILWCIAVGCHMRWYDVVVVGCILCILIYFNAFRCNGLNIL